MKNLITALSVLTLGTTVGNLSTSYNANQNAKSVNTIINQDMKKISNNINLTNINNSILKSLTKKQSTNNNRWWKLLSLLCFLWCYWSK